MNKSKKKIVMLSIFIDSANSKFDIGKMGDCFFMRYRWSNEYNSKHSVDHLDIYPTLKDAQDHLQIRLNVHMNRGEITKETHEQLTAKNTGLTENAVQ